jgi:hypothetical protein
MKEVDTPSCGRGNDLVAFLYGELSDSEKRSFESHMHECSLCQVQTGEFRSIRESVASWRDESLGCATISVPETSRPINQPKHSALAALRAFFDLSPLWMKGAVGLVAIWFCIFTVLTVARLQLAPGPAFTTQSADNKSHSQQEMSALVEQRVQEELARRKVADKPPTTAPVSVAVKDKTFKARSRVLIRQSNEVATNTRNQKARRPLSKAEREQLAADLRLVSSGNERVLDLFDDQINQQ